MADTMSTKRLKQYLMLLSAIGLIAIASGGSGTFATFNAEVSNANNTFATGTLYLHDSVNGATACTSESTQANSNVPVTVGGVNPGDQCNILFDFDGTPGHLPPSTPYTVHLKLSNAGTLDASDLKFQLNGTGCQVTDTMDTGGRITGPLSTGSPITSIPLGTPTTISIADGAAIQLREGGHTDTFTANGITPANSNSITVQSQTPTFAYANGDTVYSALGTNNACSQIPFTITETNSTYNGPAELTTTGNVNGVTGTTDTFEGCAWPVAANTNGGCDFSSADNIGAVPPRTGLGNGWDTLTLSSGGGTGNSNQLTGLDANGGARYFIITVFPQFGDPVMGETATFDINWHMDQA